MRSIVLLSLALLVPACPPSPAPPAPDSGDAAPPPLPDGGGTVYDRACAALAAVGCAEGARSNCAATMQHMQESGITRIDPAKCAAAKTKADARACGAVRCP